LLGDKVSQEGLGLALALVESGGVSLAPRVRDEFERLYNDKRGQAFAEVTSAAPLDEAMRASITSQIGQLTGKRIFLREKVDPDLLGGVTVRVGDILIDGSVRRRLELLRRRIAEGGDLGGALDGFEDVIPQLPPPPPIQAATQKRLPDLPSAGGAASRDSNQPNNGNNPRNRNNTSGKRGKRPRR
jgi:hypothetical protein